MVRTTVLIVTLGVIAILMVSAVILYWNDLGQSNKTKHETSRWAVIMDSKGDVIAVETTSIAVWYDLKNLQKNQTELWIGGIIDEYDNHWVFRFNPDTIVLAEITIEGAQANIQAISEDLDYWMNTWQKQVYVFAKVTETYE